MAAMTEFGPIAVIGWIEIRQRSRLLPHDGLTDQTAIDPLKEEET
jgi:hypothetical protein